jgi:hypothetical protein
MRLRGFSPMNIVLKGYIIGKEEVGRDKELHYLVM